MSIGYFLGDLPILCGAFPHHARGLTLNLKFCSLPGLGSTVAEVAALAVDTLSKLVTAAGAAQVRPLIPDLVPPLLESLSTLEVRMQSIDPLICYE